MASANSELASANRNSDVRKSKLERLQIEKIVHHFGGVQTYFFYVLSVVPTCRVQLHSLLCKVVSFLDFGDICSWGIWGEGSRPTFSIFCRWSQLAGSSCIVCYVKLYLFSIWKIFAPEGSGGRASRPTFGKVCAELRCREGQPETPKTLGQTFGVSVLLA